MSRATFATTTLVLLALPRLVHAAPNVPPPDKCEEKKEAMKREGWWTPAGSSSPAYSKDDLDGCNSEHGMCTFHREGTPDMACPVDLDPKQAPR